jgi:hypothetical protein
MGRLTVRVQESVSHKPLAFRAYLTDASGAFHRPDSCHIYFERAEERHFLAEDGFEATLPDGAYRLRVERGPEYVPYEATLRVGTDAATHEVILRRWVWMNACGWFSGDLHVHRNPDEMRLAVLAEDLNVGTNIVHHNRRAGSPPTPTHVHLDETTVYSTGDAEIERLFDGMGATLLLGLDSPLPEVELETLSPPDHFFTDWARRNGAHIDGEKPFWKGVPVNAALGELDSMGVVPNHFHRNKVMRESARWGAVPQDARFVGDEGFALWILDLYYRLLNCGIRLPASGGSASGIMPSPVGYCRTYVRMSEPFEYGNWFTALRNGRSFATNGPMLFLNVSDEEPGALLRFAVEKPVALEARVVALSQTGLEYVELIRDGRVIGREACPPEETRTQLEIRAEVAFDRSGWLAARCFERVDGNVRYAQTSPVYVFMGTDPVAISDDARFFEGRVRELIAQAETWNRFRNESERAELLGILRDAEVFYARVAELAENR